MAAGNRLTCGIARIGRCPVAARQCSPLAFHRKDPAAGVVAQHTGLALEQRARPEGTGAAFFDETAGVLIVLLCDVHLALERDDAIQLLSRQRCITLQVHGSGIGGLCPQRGRTRIGHQIHAGGLAGIRVACGR